MTGLPTKQEAEVGGIAGVGRPRLSAVLRGSETRTFESMMTLPSNVEAVESAMLFATGRTPFVALVGPSGCGKTHLIEAAAATLRKHDPSCWPQVLSAKVWNHHTGGADVLSPWLIDNAQELIGQHKTKLQMRLALERRVRAVRPTLIAITAHRPTRALKSFLPNQHSWVIATIDLPTPSERYKLLSKIAASHGLSLSDDLLHILAHHLHGDGRTLEGACKTLRLEDSKFLDAPSTLRAVGLISRTASMSPSWDLRDIILEVAEGCSPVALCRDLAVYVMLRVGYIPEADVATFFEVDPSTVYATARAFEERVQSDESLRNRTRWFIRQVIDRLTTC